MALTPVEIRHMTPGSGFFGYNYYIGTKAFYNEEVHHPSVWPIYALYGMGLCIPLLYAARRFVRAARVTESRSPSLRWGSPPPSSTTATTKTCWPSRSSCSV